MNKKVKTARLSILSNSVLIAMKVVAGILSGSVSILSEAIHSGMDLLAALIAFFSVKISDTPADKKHPYGHGKFENISGVVEALLILVASFWIVFEALRKIKSNEHIEAMGYGFAVMSVSALINFIVSRKLYKVARATDSIALEADALHLKADVFTSLGVAVGLLLIWITGFHWLDPVVAIMVAVFILRESFILLKTAFYPLVDTALTTEEVMMITDSIKKYSANFHHLRTRKAGNYKFVDFHLELQEDTHIKDAHDLCDMIEAEIKNQIPNVEITIHVETLGSK